jgi:hypothetical protein
MSRREFSRKVRKQAIERANGKCENKACGAVLKSGEAEIDHILPCELGRRTNAGERSGALQDMPQGQDRR